MNIPLHTVGMILLTIGALWIQLLGVYYIIARKL